MPALTAITSERTLKKSIETPTRWSSDGHEFQADLESRLAEERSQDRQLLIDSREFATDQRYLNWWHLLTCLLVIFAFACVAALAEMTWLRMLGSLLLGLTAVRMFILYHDYQHGAIFKNSFWANAILTAYGYVLLTPPSVWKRSHNHHHRNNSKLFGASIGSFPIWTTEAYQLASQLERFEYRLARSPLVIVFGYFTVFLFGMCVRPLLISPRRHWDAPLSLLTHYGIIGLCWYYVDFQTALFLCILPALIVAASGAYLFYAQHNFPGAKIRPREQWTYTGAALQSSSYLKMGAVMHWLTGNIGYHHVHHLNSKIPFYRLAETMAALPALQTPNTTTLSIRDILGCLSLKLWDAKLDRFVTFAEAKQLELDANSL